MVIIRVLNRFTWYVCRQYLFSLTKLQLEYNQHPRYSQIHWTTSKLNSIVIIIFGQSLCIARYLAMHKQAQILNSYIDLHPQNKNSYVLN